MRVILVAVSVLAVALAGCTDEAEKEERSVAISYSAQNGYTGDRNKPLSCGEWVHLAVSFNKFQSGQVFVQVLGGDDQREFEYTFRPGDSNLDRDIQGVPGIWTLKVETTDGDLGFTAELSCFV